MSLLILLFAPSVSAFLCMMGLITNQTLYPRLKGRSCHVIPFPSGPDRMRRYRSRTSI